MADLSESSGFSGLLGLSTNEEAQSLSREDVCKLTRLLFILLTICLFSVPALAGGSVELHKLTASDANVWDEFGWSVAISGATAIVGAWRDDDAGSDSGSAYLYDFNDLYNITEIKLTASDAAAEDRFGCSVALSGTTALVGAPLNNDAGSASGSAYLFDVATGRQIAKLTASDAAAGDQFGFSVALSGTTALVGALWDNDAGTVSGSAYLFDFSDPCNIIETKLTASDAAAFDFFGWSVAISGATAIVGAPLDDDAGGYSGSAYLFDFSDPCNIIEIKLTVSDAAAGDEFGSSVAISGATALVGARWDDDAGTNSGSAYLFDVATGSQITKLTASDAAAGDEFGISGAISGITALVGAFGNADAGSESGSAYLYDFSDPCNITETKLTASDAAAGDEFGNSVAISGSTALVGAWGNSDAGSGSGSAYLFCISPVGDINLDCRVDLTDFAWFAPNWMDTACGVCGGADLTGDGNVRLDDLQEFANNWLAGV